MKVKYAGKEIVILVIYLLNHAFRSVLTEWTIETRKFYKGSTICLVAVLPMLQSQPFSTSIHNSFLLSP